GKLVVHAYSYEHMEEAAYQLLRLLAERVGDEQTVEAARRIQQQEQTMAERLERLFDDAVAGALREVSPDDLGEQMNKYLGDAHAKLAAFACAFEHLEIASYQLLRRVAERARDQQTVQLADRILEQERAASGRLESLLPRALDASLREQSLAAG